MKHEKKHTPDDHELELAGPFLAVLFTLMLVGLLIPLRPDHSDRERRQLHEFPAFSVASLLDGSFFDEITLWYADTFPGREDMLEISDRVDALHGFGKSEVQLTQLTSTGNDSGKLDALLEEAETAADSGSPAGPAPTASPAVTAAPSAKPSAKPEAKPKETAEATPEPTPETVDPDAEIVNWEGLNGEEEAQMFGDLVVIDGNAVSRMGFDQVTTDHHVKLMNQAGDALAEKGIRFFNLPIPTSVSVLLSSDMLEEIGAADQGKILRYMFAKENDNVYKVNSFNNLLSHNTEYVYFHGDHHWTGLGAYYAYESFCETAGFEPVPLSEYEEKNMGEFIGTYAYSVSKNMLEPDEVIAYIPPGDIQMEITGHPEASTVIIDESENYPNMKYNCFINGDNPVTIITNNDLPDAPDCLVIKDSFGNPFVVYLTQHYHRVIVLDYRTNFLPVSQLAEEYGVDDVILAQSIGVTQTQNAQFLLDNLMK